MSLVIAILIILILLLIHLEIKRLKVSKKFKHIPGATEHPLIGSVLSIKDMSQNYEKFFTSPICKFTIGDRLVLVLNDPIALQEVLQSPVFLTRPFVFDFFDANMSLFTRNFQHWKPLRKALNPVFSTRSVLHQIPKFKKHIDRMISTIKPFIGQTECNIHTITVKYTIEQAFDTMYCMEYECDNEFPKLISDSADVITKRMARPFFYPHINYRFSWLYKTFVKVQNYFYVKLGGVLASVVEKRREIKKDEENVDARILMDELLKLRVKGEALSQAEIQENMLVFLTAGAETSAYTLAHTLILLAMYPDIDEKLHKEIKEHYDVETALDYNVIKQMTYLDMVIKEVLRLFPAVPVNGREALADSYIRDKNDYTVLRILLNISESIDATVPKGTIFLIHYFSLHKHPLLWGPNASVFNPDNFLHENVSKRHPYSYIPFSNGPRNCIGMHYANISIRMALVKILSQYRFTTQLKYEDLKSRWGVVLKLKCQYLVQVHKR